MNAASRIGAPRLLGWFWQRWWLTAIFTFTLTTIIRFSLILIDDRQINWPYWRATWSDATLLVAIMAVEAALIQRFSGSNRFYTQAWWHLFWLILGIAETYNLNQSDLQSGRYTSQQLHRLDKQWHTLFLVALVYWAATGFLPSLLSSGPKWQKVILIIMSAAILYVFWGPGMGHAGPFKTTY